MAEAMLAANITEGRKMAEEEYNRRVEVIYRDKTMADE